MSPFYDPEFKEKTKMYRVGHWTRYKTKEKQNRKR